MRRLPPLIRWTRSSTILLSAFLTVVFLIIYVWWPLAQQVLSYIDWHGPWWLYMDWLLVGLFLFMSLTIVAGADPSTSNRCRYRARVPRQERRERFYGGFGKRG